MRRDLFEQGLGSVVVSRFKANGMVEAGVFLVDTYCLGVKSAFFTRVSLWEYENEFLQTGFRSEGELDRVEPGYARALVEAAVAYAGRLGIAPHPDYRAACRVFGGIVVDAGGRSFEFGLEGNPFFIQGAHDSVERCVKVLTLLRARCREGNVFRMMQAGVDAAVRERLPWLEAARPVGPGPARSGPGSSEAGD